MVETSMGPEAVEQLARQLAAKYGVQQGTVQRFADNLVIFNQENARFQEKDQIFKDSVLEELAALKRQRTAMPNIAVAMAFASIVITLIGLAGTAQAVSKLSDHIAHQDELIHRHHLDE